LDWFVFEVFVEGGACDDDPSFNRFRLLEGAAAGWPD
jgi:hypothetical protein